MRQRRDVELVVRARDQARSTVRAITNAVRDFSKAQKDLSTGSTSTSNSLTKLGSAFGGLQKEIRGTSVFGRLATESQRASAAIESVEKSIASTRGEIAGVSKQVKTAETAYADLAGSAEKSAVALDKQKAALKSSKAEQTAANAELRKATTARDSAARSVDNLTARIAKQENTVEEATARYARLRGELQGMTNPSKSFATSVERAGTSLDKAKAKLAGLNKDLASAKTRLSAAAGDFQRISAAAERAAQNFEKQKAAVASAQQDYNQLKSSAASAGSELGKLSDRLAEARERLDSQEESLRKAKTEYKQFTAAVAESRGALAQLAREAGAELKSELDQQRAATAALSREWKSATSDVSRLEAELDELQKTAAKNIFGGPTEQQLRETAQALDLAKVKANGLGNELREQRTTLASLSSIYTETANDVDQLASRQERFAAVQARTGQAISRIRQETAQATAAINRQSGAADRAAGSNNRLAGALNGVGAGARSATSGVGALRNAYSQLYGASRQSLSIQQRIRGEALALTNSYLGLYAAIQGISGIQNTYQEIEAAQIKLGTLFEEQQVSTELKLIQEQARDLGFSFADLANQYAGLQIATNGTAVDTAETRKLFIALAQSGRVLKLSNDQVNRTFTAIQQIAQKGVLSMEELRQQLSESLPGAVDIFAEAAGYGKDELDKFYEAVGNGEISADVLADVADVLTDRFGDQLSEALEGNATAFGRFQNALENVRRRLAEGGVIDALTRFYNTVVEVTQTSEFEAFLDRVAQGLSAVIDVLSFAVRNFQLVGDAIAVVIGLKAFRFFSTLAGGIRESVTQSRALRLSTLALGGSTRAAALAFTALKAAIRGALISTGIGAIVVGITVALERWLFAVNEVDSALDDHGEVVDQIKAKYVEASGDVDKWAESLRDLNFEQAKQRLQQLGEQVDTLRDQLQESLGDSRTAVGIDLAGTVNSALGSGVLREYEEGVHRLKQELDDGGSVEAFNRGLTELLLTLEDDAPAKAEEAIRSLSERIISSSGKSSQYRFAMRSIFDTLSDNAPAEAAAKFDLLADKLYDLSPEQLAAEVRKLMEEFGVGFPPEIIDAVVDYNRRIKETSEVLEDAETAQQEAIDVVETLKAAHEGDTDALRERGQQYDDTRQQIEDTAAAEEDFASKMEKLRDLANGENGLTKLEKQTQELEAAFKEAEAAADRIPNALERIIAKGEALREFTEGLGNLQGGEILGELSGSTGVQAAANLIRREEGFRATPYYDVNAYRVGYGSDTITLADGTIRKVTQGMRVSVEDANRDLLRRIQTEFMPVARRAVGEQQFATLAPAQQAVLTSIAYNYGRIPDSVAKAVREGRSDSEVAAAIRRLSDVTDRSAKLNDAEKATLRRRRAQEAAIFSGASSNPDYVQSQVDNAGREEEERQRREERDRQRREDFQADFAERLEKQALENSLIGEGVIAREQALAVAEAQRQAEKAGVTLTADQIELIKKQTAEKYAQAAADEQQEARQERIAESERLITDLVARRNELKIAYDAATENGEQERAEELRQQLETVNEQLRQARDNAIAMWEAIGGEGSQTAILQLQNAKEKAAQLDAEAKKNQISWTDVGQVFGKHLTNAFLTFAKAVAEGEKVGDAALAAFRQFASQVLLEIAQMIIKYAILNMLKAAFGGVGGGFFSQFLGGAIGGVGTGHTGGVVGSKRIGSGNATRKLNPGVFANAPRFHGGGFPGLRAGEVAAVLKEGEEVLTEDDPRHAMNGGNKRGGQMEGGRGDVKIVNTFDSASFLEESLDTPEGTELLVNHVSRNKDQFRSALGV